MGLLVWVGAVLQLLAENIFLIGSCVEGVVVVHIVHHALGDITGLGKEVHELL
jgi:hypothetical protein